MTENNKLDIILEKLNDIDNRVSDMDKRVHRIEITLENETNKNISLIAEGHLNLDRKLGEALKSLQPNTIYHLKVNHLDGEVKKIKEVVGLS